MKFGFDEIPCKEYIPVIRKYIEQYQPNLVICGHVHEARGVDKIGVSQLVNPGPASRGFYAEIGYDGQKFDIMLKSL